MTAPEFSRPVRIDTLGSAPRRIAIEADAGERAALARRFGLIALDRLAAEAELSADDGRIAATGSIAASVVQACVATGAPLPVTLAAKFALRFVPEADAAAQEELELDAGDLDTIGYAGGAIDLGEAAAETLALELDPFPRAPDADAALRAAGIVDEADTGPFAALRALKDRLGG